MNRRLRRKIHIVPKLAGDSNAGMTEFSALWLGVLASVFMLAGMVKGVTGMGLPTVAMGLLGVVMPPAAAAALLLIPLFVTNVWQMLAGPATARLLQRLWPMLLASVSGTLGGSALLVRADPQWSAWALGLALMGYAGYALAAPAFQVNARHERWLSPSVGLVTGLITGATGVFVMPAVPYLQSLGLGKDDLVQALGLSFTTSTVALAVGLLGHGALPLGSLGWSTIAVAPALLGMWLGQRLRERLGPRRFRQCFLLLLLLLGAQLAARPFF